MLGHAMTAPLMLFRAGRSSAPRISAGALIVAGALALSLSAGAARADEVDDLRAEVEELRQQVLYLQNQVPTSGYSSGGGGGNLAAQQEVRMQQVQQQITQLTGQIERVELKLNDVAAQLERLQKDTEYRLGVLEGSAPMGATGNTGLGAAQPGASPSQEPHVTAEPTPPNTHVTPEAPPQPGVLGTLTSEQAANLPQAPAGAAEDAANRAAQQTALPGGGLQGNTPREQYEYATNLIQRGDYANAEVALKSFISQHPSDELAGNAQYWLGETYYVRNDFKTAAVAFAEGYQKYPDSQKAPDNLLKLGMALGQQGQKENACVALRQLEKRYPDASASIKDRATRAKQRYGCG
jgi:tol-pal system protein YbgF